MILVDSCGWLEMFASSRLGDVYRAELWTHDAHFRELPGVRFIVAPAEG